MYRWTFFLWTSNVLGRERVHYIVNLCRHSVFAHRPKSSRATRRLYQIRDTKQRKHLQPRVPQGLLIPELQVKNTMYKEENCQFSFHTMRFFLRNVAAVCSVMMKAESIHDTVWRWEADYLFVDRHSDWWWRGLGGQTEIQLKTCYLMVKEPEAELKQQSQKCNIYSVFPTHHWSVPFGLILLAECDPCSLCRPPPNTCPKLLYPNFCVGPFHFFLETSPFISSLNATL